MQNVHVATWFSAVHSTGMRLPHSSTGTLSGVCIRWCEAIPTLVGGSGAKCGGGDVCGDICREWRSSTVNAGDCTKRKLTVH